MARRTNELMKRTSKPNFANVPSFGRGHSKEEVNSSNN